MVNLPQDSIDEFRVRTALESVLIQLDPSWLILGDLRINGPTAIADYIALHPRRGIALIDVQPKHNAVAAAEQWLRKFLSDRGFPARFPGTLPIVRLVLKPTDAASVEQQLCAAFAQIATITIADPNWVAAINGLLAPIAAASTRPGFPLFRRPAPRWRAAPGATPAQDAPWNVGREDPADAPAGAAVARHAARRVESAGPGSEASRPPAQDAPGTAERPRDPERQSAGQPGTGQPAPEQSAGDGQPERSPPSVAARSGQGKSVEPTRRARPPRQPPRSDEPTAGQQIQSLIALLRKNGVQERMTRLSPGEDQPADDRSADDRLGDSSRRDDQSTRPIERPPEHRKTAERETSPDSAALRSERPIPAAASPIAPSPFEPAPIVDSEPPAERERDLPLVAAPPTMGDDRAAALHDDAASPAEEPEDDPGTHIVEDEASERSIAAAAAGDEPEPPAESPVSAEDIPPLEAMPAPVMAPKIDERHAASREETRPEPMAGRDLDAAPEEEAAAPTLSSGIVVPPIRNKPRAEPAEAAIPRRFSDRRPALDDEWPADDSPDDDSPAEHGVPVVPSTIVAPRGVTGLSARREDALSPPPFTPTRWRGRSAAIVLLLGILGGAGAWFRGDIPPWLMPSAGPFSVVSTVPGPAGNPPAAPQPDGNRVANSAASAPTPSAEPAAKPATPPPTASATATPATTPTTTTPAAAPSTASTAPLAPAPAQPSPAAPSSPSAVWATTTPAPAEPAAAPPKSKGAPAQAAKPTGAAPKPVVARAVPPRAVGGNATPPRTPDAVPSGAPAGSQGPPLDIADLPPMDSAATAAPPAGSAAADAAAARLHGPTSLTPTKASAAPSPGSAGAGEACHSYTATRTLLGQPRQVSGLACRDSNGQWQIISELPR